MENNPKSVKGRNERFEKELREELTAKYVNKFVDRIRKLGKDRDFVEDNSYHEVHNDVYVMYKLVFKDGLTRIVSKDGMRGYEFLVEFDRETPSYGIYYGCRGLVLGGKQDEQINIFRQEWSLLRGEITRALNNTFVDKDYSLRFQETDNGENRTFWPFWISLYEDEDVVEIAGRATKIIRNIYELFLNGRKFAPVDVKQKILSVNTFYTKAAYDSVRRQIKEDCPDPDKAKAALSLFDAFLKNATKMNILVRDRKYEKAWRFVTLSNVEAGHLIYALIEKMIPIPPKEKEKNDNNVKRKRSWQYFTPILLSKHENPLTNIRQSSKNSEIDQFTENEPFEKKAAILLEKILSFEF